MLSQHRRRNVGAHDEVATLLKQTGDRTGAGRNVENTATRGQV
jgi:hypothetical protein